MGGKWYYNPDEAEELLKKQKEEQEARRKLRGPMRWFLKKGSEGLLTFVDTPRFYLKEHNLKLDGKWGNFVTCIKEIYGQCPACDQKLYPSLVLMATVISHVPYTSTREGKTYNHQKMIIAIKGAAMEKIRRQIKRREGDLRFCQFSVARGMSDTEAATGEDWEFEDRIHPKTLLEYKPPEAADQTPEQWLTPFNYAELCAPMSANEMRQLMGVALPPGAAEDPPAMSRRQRRREEEEDGGDGRDPDLPSEKTAAPEAPASSGLPWDSGAPPTETANGAVSELGAEANTKAEVTSRRSSRQKPTRARTVDDLL